MQYRVRLSCTDLFTLLFDLSLQEIVLSVQSGVLLEDPFEFLLHRSYFLLDLLPNIVELILRGSVLGLKLIH